MNRHCFKIFALTALVAVVIASCKKDDSESTSKSMTGTFTVTAIPAYSNPGDVWHLEASGLAPAEDETDSSLEVQYSFTVGSAAADTVSSIDVVVPDTLGTFNVVAKAFMDGYYTRTSTLTTIVVGEKSLSSNLRLPVDANSFTDSRDGKSYYYSTIDSRVWMSCNLAYYEKNSDGAYTLGIPYEGESATEDVMGAYYTWADAQTACPEGWRIPTSQEWDSLGEDAGALMFKGTYNGATLWEFWPDVKITNSMHFFAEPFGYATFAEGEYTFTGFNDYAMFWADGGSAPVCRYIYMDNPAVMVWDAPSTTDFAAQLRCIKE